MNDPIGQLLRNADASLPSPAAPDGLALRVRHRRDRRWRRTTRYVVAMASIALIMLTVWLTTTIASRPAPAKHLAVSPPARQRMSDAMMLAAIDLNARLHEQTAAMLISDRRAARPAPSHASAGADVQTQRDRAALILVYEAERSAREHHPADAAAGYRRAIALFPQSPWADVARQRLKELPTS